MYTATSTDMPAPLQVTVVRLPLQQLQMIDLKAVGMRGLLVTVKQAPIMLWLALAQIRAHWK